MRFDFAIVGGGIVGLATAISLRDRRPEARIVVIEKEDFWAAHQTGRNSGVIHSGIYYKPGSLKARMAREGNQSMVEFCRQNGIAYEVCGKLIVATKPEQIPLLDKLFERGLQNQLKLERLTPAQVREVEPHVRCLAGIRVPSTGIVDYSAVCEKLAELIQEKGTELKLGTRVTAVREQGQCVMLSTSRGDLETACLINCAGLHSDRVAKLSGVDPQARIVPFRGEYYELRPERRHLVKALIYPVPNPAFPFLGVHFTRMVDGSVHAGPNAVLSFKREGYRKTDFSLRDFGEVMFFGGFWKLAARNMREGLKEMIRSFSKKEFVRSLQELIPQVKSEDLVPSAAGVRAQALLPNGSLVDDFLIVDGPYAVHVCNAPSPAATASLEIGKAIVDRIMDQRQSHLAATQIPLAPSP